MANIILMFNAFASVYLETVGGVSGLGDNAGEEDARIADAVVARVVSEANCFREVGNCAGRKRR